MCRRRLTRVWLWMSLRRDGPQGRLDLVGQLGRAELLMAERGDDPLAEEIGIARVVDMLQLAAAAFGEMAAGRRDMMRAFASRHWQTSSGGLSRLLRNMRAANGASTL